ncbi:MAG TPA: hypothetical protein DC049_09450, partial [Spirochaetia bacterium]|nr:hypothetical protein [Spirochaetia bacterium]
MITVIIILLLFLYSSVNVQAQKSVDNEVLKRKGSFYKYKSEDVKGGSYVSGDDRRNYQKLIEAAGRFFRACRQDFPEPGRQVQKCYKHNRTLLPGGKNTNPAVSVTAAQPLAS